MLGSFGKNRTETGRIARRESEVEGEINSDKGIDLKDLSVTKWIMTAHKKDKNRDIKCLGDRKVTCLGGSPSG